MMQNSWSPLVPVPVMSRVYGPGGASLGIVNWKEWWQTQGQLKGEGYEQFMRTKTSRNTAQAPRNLHGHIQWLVQH